MKTRPKRKKISQAEARRLRQQVQQLRDRLEDQLHTYPNGTVLATLNLQAESVLLAKVKTARSLGHPVIVVADGEQLRYIGIKTP